MLDEDEDEDDALGVVVGAVASVTTEDPSWWTLFKRSGVVGVMGG